MPRVASSSTYTEWMPARARASLKRLVSGVPARRSGMPSSRALAMSRASSAPFGTQLSGISRKAQTSPRGCRPPRPPPLGASGGLQAEIHVLPPHNRDFGVVGQGELVRVGVADYAEHGTVEVLLRNTRDDPATPVAEVDGFPGWERGDDLREDVDDLGVERRAAALTDDPDADV